MRLFKKYFEPDYMRRAKLISLLITVLLCLFMPSAFSQSGPGGVGNSTTNRLWLKSDAGVYRDNGVNLATNNQFVEQWNDFSGNNNNAVQGTNVPLKPAFKTNIINALPAIHFNDDFIDAPALGIPRTGGFSVITVFQATQVTLLGNQ
ncbi:MAG: hypothetical protein IPH69_11290 [Bacteroidales bacterium]|nr:hypothetical protein [Bacteroidales bacterium]